ncbi:alpha/beta fold hydrolase [Aerococcus sanguinicola]|uniref:Esterase n=1 Tax=Aerococcus sanguinicola TaxID=119206 RepID=A0A0X8FAQ4_9LACT|nr:MULTISPECIES: alpha/beta fold hydrolase [Aerococcus]AMB93720.1 esterase [Aerococcus sanguinicola]MDK7050432.1 prolyl oligopeptidase family serine peptidase [Aerococcus sanguinicola]OFT94523.1 esterase [Aerococcus sp. HMSC23C02]PKZ21550.1 esterase [Aerococcus sanguinicola]
MKITIRRRLLGQVPLLELVQEDRKNDCLPLVVYYHGWQSRKELNLTAGRRLAKAGYRALLPDAENHGERYRKYSKIPSMTFWQSIQANLFEFGFIVDHFQQLGLADDRLAVAGVSMGGITTCALLCQHPEIQAAACLMGSPMPVHYAQGIARHAREAGRYFPKDAKTLLGWLEDYDLSIQANQLGNRPLFIWHGRQDDRIPFQEAATFVQANPQLKLHFQAEDEGHLVRVETIKSMVNFFTDHFPL